MKLDVSQALSDMRKLLQSGVPHEEDFLFFKQLQRQGRPVVFVDVGANAGQSAISFLMNCPNGRVISFEPNQLYAPVLEGVQGLLGGRFEFHMYGLSDAESELDLLRTPCRWRAIYAGSVIDIGSIREALGK